MIVKANFEGLQKCYEEIDWRPTNKLKDVEQKYEALPLIVR